ncbi:MAG: hypothetical protein U5O16_22100, partial [Rhodococcus sp. (in: high G+C Gram-positive bacteria)]|uniref:hypothetical protein n=1 Tax=Rhodococcus sp. TaxID=1831 RepID=UPI002AD80541|nr:hypothetical protein [Rhodococcus sp. (in: high G+C Gram-positive bacteria)]
MTELVIASIGLRSGLLTPVGFACLAIVALISTALSGPVAELARLPRGTRIVPRRRSGGNPSNG